MKKYVYATGAALLVAMVLLSPCSGAEAATNKMDQLLGVLKSDATLEKKSSACRELGLYGSKNAVPVLAGLLGDEKLSHMARYGLEQIPDPAVDEAFRAALGKLKGNLLIGVINSIGCRHDVKAVEPLGLLLKDPDRQVVLAAAAALGRIGTVDAGKLLEGALDRAKGKDLESVSEEVLGCADALAAKKYESKATGLYEKVAKAEVPARLKASAKRGIILCNGDSKALIELLGSDDQVMFTMGLRVAQELTDKKVTPAIIFQLGRLSTERVVQLIQVLGKRGEKSAVPELLKIAKGGEKVLRLASVRALAELGDSRAAPVLMDLLKDTDGQIVQAAAMTLAVLPAPEVNDDVVKMLEFPDNAVRIRMIDLAGQRRIKKAIPLLVKAMEDKDDAVRFAAITNFGMLSGMPEFPSLLDKLGRSTNAGEIAALEKAVSAICQTGNEQKSCVQKLSEALPKATLESKQAILRVLRVSGGPEALKTVRGAVSDSSKEVHMAAMRALSEWKTADAAPVLLELAKSSTEEVDKVLSLRGYLGMASRKDLSAKEKMTICTEAAPLIKRDDEKKMLMGALGGTGNTESISLIAGYLDEPNLKRDAVLTVLAIAQKGSAKQNAAGAKSALEKIVKIAENPEDVKKAEELLKQIGNLKK